MSSSLVQAIRINNGIRQVVEASRQVNYVALNALLISRKAGAGSLGFAVVARELRSMSRDLEKYMNQLDQVISHLVRDVAATISRTRQLDYMHAALRTCHQPPACMARTLAGMRTRIAEREDEIARDWASFSFSFDRAMRLSELGGVLSRNAKVEAAHGGAMANALRLVAEEIEKHVGRVAELLQGLRRLMAA